MSKYKAKRVQVDDIWFDSMSEAGYYLYLKQMEKEKKIRPNTLKTHPRFPIIYNGKKLCDVLGDFRYVDNKDCEVIIDVKGKDTPVSKLKRKLIKAFWGIDMIVIPATGWSEWYKSYEKSASKNSAPSVGKKRQV